MSKGLGEIKCSGMDQFIEVIAGLVAKGLTFTADSDRLIVTLTGGF